MTFFPGWTYRPDDIAASHDRLSACGGLVAGGGSSFRGAWEESVSRGQTHFLAVTVEPDPGVPAYMQSTGVCTSMLYRALQDCYNWDRRKFGTPSRPAKLAFETLFGGSRVNIGRGQLGYSDGSIGAWIAEFVARFGVLERGVYGQWDLTKPNEQLAQEWGKPGRGVPPELLELGKAHRFKAHKAESTDEIFDGLACGMFGGICRSHYVHNVDRDGYGIFNNAGGHHTCLRGAFVDRRNNRRGFVEQQTHGSGVPSERPIAYTTDWDVVLSDGAYLVREEDVARFMRSGEVWLFQSIDGEEFRYIQSSDARQRHLGQLSD